MPAKLQRAVIREEFVELLGDYVLALILHRFLELQAITEDIDQYVREEVQRARSNREDVQISETYGWIHKDATELASEIMIDASKSTMSRKLSSLVELAYVLRRRNPIYAYDRTYQYRVDLVKLQGDLAMLGYPLDGWQIERDKQVAYSNHEVAERNLEVSPPHSDDAYRNMRSTTVQPRKSPDDTAIPDRSKSNGLDRSSLSEGSPESTAAKAWQKYGVELREVSEKGSSSAADELARELVELLGITDRQATKLSNDCVGRGETEMLREVGQRVAGQDYERPWAALLTSVVAERQAESNKTSRHATEQVDRKDYAQQTTDLRVRDLLEQE